MRPTTLLAAILLVAVVAITLTGVVRYRPRPETGSVADGAAAPPDPLPGAPVEPPAPPPTGRVVVDARPWAKLVAIEAAGGEAWDLPAVTTTPLRLELPAGGWRLDLLHPRRPGERRVCEIELAAGGSERCEVEFAALSVDGYFREQGWWR